MPIGRGAQAEGRLLGDAVERHLDMIDCAAGGHIDLAGLAIDHIGRRPYGFERIALLAARRRHIADLIAHAHLVVEAALQGGQRQPGAVILHRHRIGLHCDLDLRRSAGILAGIEAIIDQLFYQGDGPPGAIIADLGGQLALRKEFQRAAEGEDLAVEGRRTHRRPRVWWV